MIYSFPQPYPDELWYSVLCRYHDHSGNLREKYSNIELFGNKPHSFRISTMLATSLEYTLQQLPPGMFSFEDIIRQHTMAPVVTHLNPAKMEMIIQTCKGDVPTVQRVTTLAKNTEANVLKYCPVCWKEDEAKYGERYWHREHQISFVGYCMKHQCKLHGVRTDRRQRKSDGYPEKGNFIIANKVEINTNVEKNFNRFPAEQELKELLWGDKTNPFSSEEILMALYKKGYVKRFHPRIETTMLLNDLMQAYPDWPVSDICSQLSIKFIRTTVYTEIILLLLNFLKDEMEPFTGDFVSWYETNLSNSVLPYFKKHKSIMETARQTGISVEVVERIARHLNYKTGRERKVNEVNQRTAALRKLPTEQRKEEYRKIWLESGVSQFTTLQEALCGLSKIEMRTYKWLRDYDNTWLEKNRPPKRGEKTRKEIESLVKEMLSGQMLSQKKIAERLNISPLTYRKHCRKLGIPSDSRKLKSYVSKQFSDDTTPKIR